MFVPATECREALRALPTGIARPPGTADAVARDGQIASGGTGHRSTFFDYSPAHADAARHRRTVPFADAVIPILGPVELAVFKAMFDRTRDWADNEAMVGAGTLDVASVATSLRSMLGNDDGRLARLDEAAHRGRGCPTPGR